MAMGQFVLRFGAPGDLMWPNVLGLGILAASGLIRLSASQIVFFFQAEDGIRDLIVTGVQTCALPISVSASNGCRYCIASHGAAARSKGMSEAQYSELLAIVGLANETNRMVTALDVQVDRDRKSVV